MGDETYIDTPEDSEEELIPRIIRLVEEVEGADSFSSSSLYDIIEADALEQVIESTDPNTHVHFEYHDRPIRVYGDERIEISAASD